MVLRRALRVREKSSAMNIRIWLKFAVCCQGVGCWGFKSWTQSSLCFQNSMILLVVKRPLKSLIVKMKRNCISLKPRAIIKHIREKIRNNWQIIGWRLLKRRAKGLSIDDSEISLFRLLVFFFSVKPRFATFLSKIIVVHFHLLHQSLHADSSSYDRDVLFVFCPRGDFAQKAKSWGGTLVTRTYRVFSLTWPASLQIYWDKRKRLHKKRVQLPQDWSGTPTWPPFYCFGTPIWPPWRHVKTLYIKESTYIWNIQSVSRFAWTGAARNR